MQTLWKLSREYQEHIDDLLELVMKDITDGAYRPKPAPPAFQDDRFDAVPLMSGKIAAGNALEVLDESDRSLAFTRSFLRRWKRPICVQVGAKEESMLPVITPNDVVLLDQDDPAVTGATTPDPSDIYAVRVDGGSTLKRVDLVRDGDRAWLALMSENQDKRKYPVRMLPVEEGASWHRYLIGRVVWHGQHMKER